MRILAIGNSFSQDATRYLQGIAEADGFELEVLNLYIGGCSLETHCNNMKSGKSVYEMQHRGQNSEKFISLEAALRSDKWDIVTLQQASHFSFIYETYIPYIFELRDFVKSILPDAKIYLHQTWAYKDGGEMLNNVGIENSKAMFIKVEEAYGRIRNELEPDDFIPCGKMFTDLKELGFKDLHRDSFHASLGIGRFALALLWYRVISGKTVSGNSYSEFDEAVDENEIKMIKHYIDNI